MTIDITNWVEEASNPARIREPLISLKTNKLIGFSSSFMRDNNLNKKKNIKIFTKEEGNKIKIGFFFFDKKEDAKKLTRVGSGDASFTSASQIFNKFKFNSKNMKKTQFAPKKEIVNGSEFYYIEIDKD